MQWDKLIERSIWAMWGVVVVVAVLWAAVGSIGFFVKSEWVPEDTAGWVQAVGSMAAIAATFIIARGDRSFARETTRHRERVVIRAVEEHCIQAYGAIKMLNNEMRNHYQPITTKSPIELRKPQGQLEDNLRNLNAIDLMSVPTIDVIDCILVTRSITQLCLERSQKGWDPRAAVEVNEYSPLEFHLTQMYSQVEKLRKCMTSVG